MVLRNLQSKFHIRNLKSQICFNPRSLAMFNITGNVNRNYCDRISRRSFVQAGALGVGGLMLPDLLRAEQAAGIGKSEKSLINIFLGGGPSHTDMFDLKPKAPIEYRGEFNPIKTNVDGMEICELMPQLAQMADKYAVLRSIVGTYDDHNSYHTQAGYRESDLKPVGGWPSIGSVVSKLKGPTETGAPSFVSTMGNTSPGFLGAVHRPYRPDGPGRDNLKMRREMEGDRLRHRAELRAGLDRLRKESDASGEMNALDNFTARAVDVVTSGKLAEALDVNQESKSTRDRYGSEDGRSFLLARRLIEAGSRCVTFNWGGWDTHSNNFTSLRKQLPKLDTAMSALISDLYQRGMLENTMIIMWGEFGRTPRVNKTAGRDHWSRVMQAFVAGGKLKTGQVIGSTDRYGGEADDRPIHLREVFATMYHHFGIDAKNTTIHDTAGRPQYLVDGREPIRELI